jgi:hypothetical protein
VLLGFVEAWQRRCGSGEEREKSVRERNGDLKEEEEKRREFGEEMKNEGEEGRERGLRRSRGRFGERERWFELREGEWKREKVKKAPLPCNGYLIRPVCRGIRVVCIGSRGRTEKKYKIKPCMQ